MIPNVKERRSYVRGDFSYSIKFRILSVDECELRKMTGNQMSFSHQKQLKIATVLADREDSAGAIPPGLIEFIMRMDEKLDQILTLLTDNEDCQQQFHQGLGVDISATGMGIITDIPVVPKQKIQAKIILSKLPFISLDVIGEVIQVKPAAKKDKRMHHIGIQFLDLNPSDKEKIIKCVFQNERAIIRERKLKEEAANQSEQ